MSNLKFDKVNHLYYIEDDNSEKKFLISVTQLLKKHGLTPDYSLVNPNILHLKAERGRIIHEELENYINKKIVGYTNELDAFIKQCLNMNIVATASEFIVNNQELAGTVDVIGNIDGKSFIGDFKTTSSLHRESVAWQLSLYAYLSGQQFEKFLCFHFCDSNTCKVIEIQPISLQEIENLLNCERNKLIYQRKTLEIDSTTCEKLLTIQRALKNLENQKKLLENQENEFKEKLLTLMEEAGVKSIDNDYFKINYLSPSTREIIDNKRLKEELPEIAKKYIKISQVKARLTIDLKG